MQQQPLRRQRLQAGELLRVFREAILRDIKAAGVATSQAATGEETRVGPQLATKPSRAKRSDWIPAPQCCQFRLFLNL